IAEDLVVLQRDRRGDGGRAAYLFVAAPSGWDPGARGGASLADLHAPVPHAGRLRAAGAAIADAMVDKGPFVRYVWSLVADDAPSRHPRRHPATPLDGRDPATWWLRVERQTTLPLPRLGAAAFFIRVLHQPLARAVDGPGRRARMASAVRSMDAALRAYKGLAGSADALLDWLERPEATG
ncbi:MAG: heme-dependent oxidative N-demethylase subunit alpha family protein, partial [Trueperaceae bacterium]